jgi:RHS repeat-associated protein
VGVANPYTPAGDLWQYQLGNNLWETRSFDPLLRWTGVSLGATKGGAERFQTGLTYYKNDNPKTQTITDTVTGNPLARVQNYTYDPANRISTVAEDTAWQRTFGYDRWANAYVSPDTTKSYGLRVSSFTPNSTLWFDSSTNRINSGGGMTMNYDLDGNLLQMGTSIYTYDTKGRMLTAANGSTTTYAYNGLGQRVSKTTGGQSTFYVYDVQGNLIAEYGAASGTASTVYLTTDHLGSTRAITDGSGTLLSRRDYLPFGEEIPAQNNGRTQIWGTVDSVTQKFTGKERDAETGLDFFGGKLTDPNGDTQGQMPSQENSGSSSLPPGLRFGDFISRYYSSAQGRFTSPDFPLLDQSVESPQSWNLFSYVMNNPLTFFDPNGGKCKKTKDGFEGDCASPGDEKVTEGDKPQVANVNGQQGSLFGLFMASGVPRYVPNDKPLPENARKVITVAYLRTQHDLGCVGLGGAITGGSVAASSPIIPKPFSAGGVSSTSPASKVLGGINIGKSIPTPVGMPGTSSFAWRASANLGRIAGRYLPYVGTVVGAAATYACLSN